MYDPWNLGGLNPSFFVIWGGLAFFLWWLGGGSPPPSPYVEPPLLIVQLNKLQSYSRISALGPVGHCTSRFKRAVYISCRPRVDVHMGGGGVRPMWTGGSKTGFFCGRHKWMALSNRAFSVAGPHSGMGYLWHCACSLGFSNFSYAHLKKFPFSHTRIGSASE